MLAGAAAGAVIIGTFGVAWGLTQEDSASLAAARTATAGTQVETIPATLFGMNVSGLSEGRVPTGASSLRIWDAGVTWREMEPEQGDIDWTPLDNIVANAKKSGFTNILYVLGSTPSWAAGPPVAGEVYGPGSASFPKKQSYYLDYVSQVVHRYKGKINSYQVWNEAELKDFYNGTPEELAELTAETYDLVKSIDANADVAAAGLVPRPGRMDPGTFDDKYLKALQSRDWPVDAFVISMYPENLDPTQRGTFSQVLTGALQSMDAPPKPIWESEANYASADLKEFATDDQVRLVARTYIDSPQLGLNPVFWYGWENDWPQIGIRMTTPDGEPTAAGVAYATVKDWMAGRQWLGCTTDEQGVTACLTSGRGPNTTIVYSNETRSLTVPAGVKVCYLDGSCTRAPAGSQIDITPTPIQLSAP